MEQYFNTEADSREILLDGVHYVLLNHRGTEWRLASDNPLWREELAALPPRPEPAELEALNSRGVWLAPVAETSSIALACCGLGAAWPGMGKELYANFPVARKAMEELASYAEWDVLSLLNETDPSVINSLRWQIPFLFLLEYAQWRQLEALGFKPDAICGHSIGELVALGVAGVYDARSAWYLFDTRAEHIVGLEARSGRATGMLAVSADAEAVAEILAECPAVAIANANTRGQFVLGGPRAELLQIRKRLRRARVVAFMLPMGMAFHNPAMAVLRDLSYRRLLALNMRPPAIPLVSCVDGTRYPVDKEEICRAITRLDENMVNWTGCVRTIDGRWNIREWVELGPQEILCGLIKENAPRAECLAADRKDREASSMRELCCRLFVNGHLSWERILREKTSRPDENSRSEIPEIARDVPKLPPLDEDGRKVLEALAQVSGRSLSEGDLHLDLRRDLALRSSAFPRLVQEAENRLGRAVSLENIPQISSAGDLIQFLTGNPADKKRSESRRGESDPPRVPRYNLERFAFENGVSKPAPLNPVRSGIRFSPGSLVCLLTPNPENYPDLWAALGASGCKIAVPWIQREICAELAGGGEVLSLDCDPLSGADEIEKALRKVSDASGLFDAILLLAAARSEMTGAENAIVAGAANFEKYLKDKGELIILRRIREGERGEPTPETGEKSRIIDRIVALKGENSPARFDAEDLLLLEIFYGSGRRVVWRAPGAEPAPRFCPSSRIYTDIFPAMERSAGQWERQISLFASPELAAHGGGEFNPLSDPLFPDSPWTPLGAAVADLLLAANLSNPWLIPFGLSDSRVFRLPSLPRATTRICRFKCENRLWLPQDGRLSRLCQVWSSAERVSANGRATGEWERSAEGLALLSTGTNWPRRLWNPDGFGEDQARRGMDLNSLYASLNFGKEWRLLRSLELVESEKDKNRRFAASLDLPASVADDANWRYKKIGLMIEAVFQAAAGVLSNESLFDAASRREFMARIGFIRFNFSELELSASPRLQLELSWREASLVRFDAQLLDDHNRATLTVNHLEFDIKNDSSGNDARRPSSAISESGEDNEI